ncbi:MAG: ABC transporter ATP-binding protein [Pseudomonadota bacterium]
MASIELKDISFCYPGSATPVIEALDLEVERGEAHALLGASGSGKTTLLSLLSGLLRPTGGAIVFDGNEVTDLSPRERHVAQVFQFPVLYERMSVIENITFAIREQSAQIDARVQHIVEALGLGKISALRPGQLSLYQKQICAVAKALANPEVSLILLDEPLTSVEPAAKARLREVLTAAQNEFATTMIYVTHDQTEALTFAQRVSVITEQGILQTAPPDEIYNQPAHEYVGYFVGSPGMNFVTREGERVGFRPEWCHLHATSGIAVEVTTCRFEGTRAGRAHGLVELSSASGPLFYRGPIDAVKTGTQTRLGIDRGLRYRDARMVGVL